MLKNMLLGLFLWVFAGVVAAAEKPPAKNQGDPLSQISSLIEAERWAEAENRWRSLQGQVDPLAWHYNLGVLLTRQGKTAQAAEQFERALSSTMPAAMVWQALKQVRAFEARAAYAALFKDAPKPELNLKLLPARALDSRHASTVQAVRTALEGWRRAWMGQDVAAYLAFYAPDYRPVSGLSHQAWVAQRRVRVTRPKFIDIELSDVTIEPLTATRVAATFRQHYRSDRINDVVTKRLIWEKRGDDWVIVREVVLR